MARYFKKAAPKAALVLSQQPHEEDAYSSSHWVPQVVEVLNFGPDPDGQQMGISHRFWVSSNTIEFGVVWGMLGGHDSNWKPCYMFPVAPKVCAAWGQMMFLNTAYHIYDIQRADDMSL